MAPVDGSYNVTAQIDWVDRDGTGRDARLTKLNGDGSPGPTLLGPSHLIQGDGSQVHNGTFPLKEGDTIQLTVANQGDNGDAKSAD